MVHELGHSDRGGMSTMCSSECVVDENFGMGSQLRWGVGKQAGICSSFQKAQATRAKTTEQSRTTY